MLGTNIAHYHISANLGRGGMGEVYRATDAKLDRGVAIKILPFEFSRNPERLARFEREAKVLASLSHPNIAGIFGLEDFDGGKALILELVEGPDLSQRLQQGGLPVEDALDVAKQIAEALEAAHEKGVIHRDLKPGNVKLAKDGKVKVLDFGLAKAETESSSSTEEDLISPTITADFTLPGTLLGTAGYMSPEQARGKPVDKRSDIWSFGCVLWECLTGRRLFAGENATDSIGALLHKEIDWNQLPSRTPPTIQLLLRKCLVRDRKRRLRDMGDAVVDLEQAIADPSNSLIQMREDAPKESTRSNLSQWMITVLFVVLACAMMAGLNAFYQRPPVVQQVQPVRHLEVALGVDHSLFLNRGTSVRLSPDGTAVAYIIKSMPHERSERHLFVRRLNELKARRIEAADGLDMFSFSPGGRRIVFYADDALKVVSITGGAARKIWDVHNALGIDWGEDNTIVVGSYAGGLHRVPAAGGDAEALTTVKEGVMAHRYPHFLPGGRAVLFTEQRSLMDPDSADILALSLSEEGGSPRLIWSGGSDARFLSSGHLVFLQHKTLFAAAFDPDSLSLLEDPIPVVEDVGEGYCGEGHFNASANGILAYVKEDFDRNNHVFEWVDREGSRELLTSLPPAQYGTFRLSPDGRYLAFEVNDGEQQDIWIHDIARGFSDRLTSSPADDTRPVWSPSGQSIVFSSARDSQGDLYWKRADGSGEAHLLIESSNPQFPWSWHPDGRYLAIYEVLPNYGSALRIVHLEGDDIQGWKAGRTESFVETRFTEWSASFSTDGRWLAYGINGSGGYQVYVRSFPGGGNANRISIEGLGSSWPRWARHSNEIVFGTDEGIENERQVFVAGFRIEGDAFISDHPERWPGSAFAPPGGMTGFDLHPKGDRILVRRSAEKPATPQRGNNHVVLIENFPKYLEQRVPRGTHD